MSSYIPVTLVGSNLGQRHRYLNSLVNEAHRQDVEFTNIQDQSEQSSIDRLFKIDLAIKIKNLDFVINNLKNDDLLYVSKALKCDWLLDPQYIHVINPTNLEEVLYPNMAAVAVKKMRNWIHINLKDSVRNEDFYNYYVKCGNNQLAIKHLPHSSQDFVLEAVKNNQYIFENLSPKYLKILCEKNSKICKFYFEFLESNQTALNNYIKNEAKYYANLSFLLKVDSDIYLDITEKYFNRNKFKKFSPEATKYIMKHRKDRFLKKPELYSAWLLHMETLGKLLSSDEIKDVVLKLARAKYLNWTFSYKTVEPLLKEINPSEKSEFKKQIFVDKSFGEAIQNWPYTPPYSPQIEKPEGHIFLDNNPQTDDISFRSGCVKRRLCKRSIRKKSAKIIKPKTLLDVLFDQYRFTSFSQTFFELQARMSTESSVQNRQFIMLVLVSKSGGHAENVRALLQLLASRHSNEPATLRAAVVRSLVRRAAAWRLPDDIWQLLLQLARGLGLDGSPPEAACCEGLHAVVLRDMLLGYTTERSIRTAFLKDFSPLVEYALNAFERRIVGEALPAMLLTAIEE